MEDKVSSISFETLNKNEALKVLETNKDTGLSSEEAKARLEKFGENKLKEQKKDSVIKIFFSQMNDSMIFVLFAAILVTIGVSIYETVKQGFDFFNVGDWPDVIIILAVILMNAFIGTIQEVKAQASLEALKKMASPETVVIRDSKRVTIKSSQLVPGDIVVLEEGNTIGADIRLIESYNLKTNESSLTGESLPVEKDSDYVFSSEVALGDRVNMLYMSTPVVYGRGLGVVVKTGMDTEIGKIASALDTEEQMTPLQQVLAKLSKTLGLLTLGIVVAVLLVQIVWLLIGGFGASIDHWIDAVLSSIALAVAAIPEGLPAVVTIVLSIGVQRMVKANTIVRKLASVETLGAVSVVCSDKTGTLTQNKMTVVEASTINNHYTQKDFFEKNDDEMVRMLARGMSLCSNASVDEGLYGDPTEIALVQMANEFNMHKSALEQLYPRVDELPFDSVRKMMSTKHLFNGKPFIFTKGALDSILSRATKIFDNGKVRAITKKDIELINKINMEYADRALRVLALAYSEKDTIDEEDLAFVGVVAMIDPARPEAKPAVEKFKEAGITTVMITGDHKDTAFAIARELGIADSKEQCMLGAEVDKLTEDELVEATKTIRVFSRVSPENKVQIVKAFQKAGNICAMTGDGVNDAPSLRNANIGIAMGITGTDVSKEAADMVLTDDNFASIEKATEEGRGIYANIKKTVIFLLSSNIAEVAAMFLIVLVGLETPLLAIHLLWINLVTDSLPAIALGMDPKDPNNMKDKPRDPNEGIFANGGMRRTIFYGVVISIAVLVAYLSHAWFNGFFRYADIKAFYLDPEQLKHAQTMAFCTLAFSELFHMVGMSNHRKSFIQVFKNKNWMMLLALVFGVGLQLLVIEVPAMQRLFSTSDLNLEEWLVTAGMSVLPLFVHEVVFLVHKVFKIKQQ